MEFQKWLDKNWEKDNIFPPCLEDQLAIDFLCKYLLGEDYHTVTPLCTTQANCEIVHDILYKYSKKYRKEIKNIKKYRRYKTKLKY